MIQPHGSKELNSLYVVDKQLNEELIKKTATLKEVVVSSASAANAVMLGAGYFNPLNSFMTVADGLAVAESMQTEAGIFFPVPVFNRLESADGFEVGDQIALRDPNIEGNPVLAIQTVTAIEQLSDQQIDEMALKVYATADKNHPGVAAFYEQGKYVIAGPIQVLNFSYFETEFSETFQTAYQIRDEIAERGWQTVVAFQTRNPMHLAHEELCKMAMQKVDADGCIIHMLLGKLKQGDIPAPVRDKAIRTMVEHYFPENTVMISGYGFDMLYAGPREAVLHALFRQNMGATHFIVGRDHAGVGDYYGEFDAQAIFDLPVVQQSLKIEIIKADHTAYSKKLNKVVMMRDVPDHRPEDFLVLSGTRMRELLQQGELPPPELSRPEVAQVLIDYYQSISKA